jgi:hypothetical protein
LAGKGEEMRSLRPWMLVVAAVVLSQGCARQHAVSPVRLRYMFTPQQQLGYRVQSRVTAQVGAENNRKTVIELEQDLLCRFAVKDVAADGTGTLEMVLERLSIQTSASGKREIVFDSGESESPGNLSPELLPLALLVGKPLRLRQLPTGEVTDITGIEAIYREALKNARPDQKQTIEAAMKQSQGSSVGVFGLGVLLPNEPVRVGQRWSSQKGPFPFYCCGDQFAYEYDYLLERISEDTASVKFSRRVSVTRSLAEMEAELLRQSGMGGHWVHDIRRGVLLSAEAELRQTAQAFGGASLQTKTQWQVSLLDEDESAPD